MGGHQGAFSVAVAATSTLIACDGLLGFDRFSTVEHARAGTSGRSGTSGAAGGFKNGFGGATSNWLSGGTSSGGSEFGLGGTSSGGTSSGAGAISFGGMLSGGTSFDGSSSGGSELTSGGTSFDGSSSGGSELTSGGTSFGGSSSGGSELTSGGTSFGGGGGTTSGGATYVGGGTSCGGSSSGGSGLTSGGTSFGGVPVGGASSAGSTGTSPPISPLDTTLGSVLITTSDRTCAGTLISNGWILTANTCLSCSRDATDIKVQYGNQLRSVGTVKRYPDSDCSQGTLPVGRDLMLLRLNAPILVNGSSYGYFQTFAHFATVKLDPSDDELDFAKVICSGWDMRPGVAWSRPVLQTPELPNLAQQIDSSNESTSRGDQLWVGNSVPSAPLLGLLPTNNDVGGGCWVKWRNRDYLVGVIPGPPSVARIYAPGNHLESRITAITDPKIQHFLWNALSGTLEFAGFGDGSAIEAVVIAPTITDYFWVNAAGQLQMRRRDSDVMSETVDLALPQGVASFWVEQPSVSSISDTTIWVTVRDHLGTLWMASRQIDSWQAWKALPAPPLSTSVSVGRFKDGRVYVFGVTTDSRLQVAAFDETGELLVAWKDVTVPSWAPKWLSRPTINATDRTRILRDSIDVHVLGADGCVWATAMWSPTDWMDMGCLLPNAAGQSAQAAWSYDRLDDFYRRSDGQLVRDYTDNWRWSAYTTIFDGQVDSTFTPMALTVPFHGSYELAARSGSSLRVLRFPY
ncbi:MAG TPA: trypsin-like serine protease [Polyangiaceae bacterium]